MTGQNMRRKSMWFSRHGKHAKVDPFYYRNERKSKQRPQEWFGSIGELFGKRAR